jgi:phosphoglycolate phosphatase
MHESARLRALRYGRLFWDLDGTLTDPRDGIVRSVAHALAALDIPVDPGGLPRFIGPSLARSFREQYGLQGDALEHALALYRERYARMGWRENVPVAGIAELLGDLGRAGARMAVATLKPKPMAERILAHFGLRRHFEAVYGADPALFAQDKSEILVAALAASAPPGGARSVMIGDHEDDVRAARRCGIDAIAVAWGYGDGEAVRGAAPTAVAPDVADLRRLLLPEGMGGAPPVDPEYATMHETAAKGRHGEEGRWTGREGARSP